MVHAMTRLVQIRWFLPLSVVVFSAVGAWLMTSGEASRRVLGLGTILFFGVGGGAAAVGQLLGASGVRVTLGKVPVPNGETQDAVILQHRPMSNVLGIIAGVGLVAGCAVFALSDAISRPDVRVVAALCGVFFAIAVILRLRPGGGRASTLALTPWGLLDKEGVEGLTCVPWTVIGGVRRTVYKGLPVLVLELRDPRSVVREGGAKAFGMISGAFVRANEVPVSLHGLGPPPDRIESLVQQFLDTSRSRATDGGVAPWPPVDDLAADLLPVRLRSESGGAAS